MRNAVDRAYFSRRASEARTAARLTEDISATRAHQAFAAAYEALIVTLDSRARPDEACAVRSGSPATQPR